MAGLFRPPVATFSSPYKPVDLMFAEMAQASGTVSRTEALSVPAVQRGRNLLCSIATLPLQQIGPDRSVVRSPLLEQIDPDVPNVVTLSQTVEDLLFVGVSWWRITGFDFAGYPMTARHLDPATVSVEPPQGRTSAPLPSGLDPRQGVVWVDGKPVGAAEMIRFDSPNPAVLTVGGRAIRRAILLDRAAAMYADDPRPLDYFSPADGADEVDDDEVKEILAKWKAARKRRSTAWVPSALKYNTVDSPSPADLQLAELQKQAGLDIANALGVDPEELGISTTSRTYSNAVDRRRDRINDVLAPYMRAITDRLSMGDVTRRGYSVRFDLTDYLKSNPTEQINVLKTAKDAGAIDAEEIRAALGLPAGAPSEPEPTPESEPTQEAEAEVEPESVDASRRPVLTFGTASYRFVDLPLETFKVDAETRTIEGLALPYGKQAGKYGGIRFEKGALKFTDVGRVKLLRDHGEAIGVAVKLTDSTAGFVARFKVARGAAGDEALSLAEDGVLDGLSVGVDFDEATDTIPDPRHKGGTLVRRADLREVSLTAMPAFDDARVTKVAASRTTEENPMPDETTVAETAPAVVPGAGGLTLSDEQATALLALVQAKDERQVVNPTRPTQAVVTREALPYRFDRGGNFAPVGPGEHIFSADLHEMALLGDIYGDRSDAGKRVMELMRRTFVISTDIDELNPTVQRPDMYVDQRDYRYPIFGSIDRGAPPNGVQPFAFPKFSSASGLVGDHVEGTEPTAGTFVTTSQTVTPTALSGKARLTREIWDMGGNPAVSTLIFNQMVRGYREGLESSAATFLNTLTAATDINLGTAATDAAFTAAWEAAVAGLQFVRGYDFTTFVVDQTTYLKAVGARATDGRAYYPQITPTNASGQAEPRFAQLNMAGITALPSWALPSTPGSPNNSWLYDPTVVWAWSTPPQRLEFPGSGAANIYTPVAGVDIAIWGYKAFANTDIAGVRQVIYDSV